MSYTVARRIAFAASALSGGLMLAACGSATSSSAVAPAATSAATSSAAASSTGAGAGGSGYGGGYRYSAPSSSAATTTGKPITATETDFHIALSTLSLTPGTYTFTVHNSGQYTHALTVNGPGVDNQSSGDITPGATGTVTVALAAGSYEVYCPVANHKMLGMDEHITVA